MAFRRTPLLALVAACLLVPAAPAPARIQIGISEQNANMFSNRYFAPLKIRYARIVVPWNIMSRHDYWPGYLRAWLAGAKRRHVQPHVAFNIVDFTPRYFGKGPTAKQYRTLIKRFRKKYARVRVFTPWNEENHVFQPTARHPKLAYTYYRILKRTCPKCTVLAADVLDDANLTRWLSRYKRYFHGRGIWGIHNYQDANHHRSFRTSWTRKFARMVRGPIWSTEAGGLVGFKTVKGRVAYRYSLSRQLRAQRYLFTLMSHRQVRNRYQRVYIYNWFGSWTKTRRTNRWDSGLIAVNGKPRPAYWDLKRRTRHR